MHITLMPYMTPSGAFDPPTHYYYICIVVGVIATGKRPEGQMEVVGVLLERRSEARWKWCIVCYQKVGQMAYFP